MTWTIELEMEMVNCAVITILNVDKKLYLAASLDEDGTREGKYCFSV